MLIYLIYFILFAVVAVEYEFRPFQSKIPMLVIAILLIGLAGFRSPEVARDYEAYQMNFEIIPNIDDPIFLTIFEPGFIAIVYVIRLFSDQNYAMLIMLCFAICSVSIKIKSISSLSVNPYLVILFYFSHYFILHEMTQIRIGLASAIFLFSIPYYLKGNRKAFAGLVLLATAFHYSAILYLGILLLNKHTFNRLVYAGALGLSIILAYLRLPFASIFTQLNTTNAKLNTYVELGQRGLLEDVNVFNVITITNFICCWYYILFLPRTVILADKRLSLFIKCNVLSIFLLSLLSGVPSVAFRASELFGVTSMFLFAGLIKFLPLQKANIFLLILLSGFIFYVVAFYGGGLLSEYKVVKFR
jgi:EpsG family